MGLTLNAVYLKVPEGHIAFAGGLTGANARGKASEAARENLKEAVALVIQANAGLAEEQAGKE